MSIRNKLTLQFALIAAAILLMASFFVYFLSARYRQEEFYERLHNKASSTARLLIEVNEVDHNLLRIIDRNTISLPSEQIVIFNYLNEEIYNSAETHKLELDEALLDVIRIRQEVRFSQDQKEFMGILYADALNRFVVVASATDVYGLRKLHNLRLVLLSVFAGSTLLMVAGGWIFSQQALQPITHVIGQVDQISGSNLHARVDEGNGQDEIAQLSKTFNKMLDRVESAFHTQKSFVSNASHELRTPLTAITGEIEVALLKPRKDEEYRNVLCSVLEDIRKLTYLSNNLLELAHVDPHTSHIALTPLRMDELVLHSRQELLQRKPHYYIHIEYLNFPEEEQGLLISGNESLLKSAIINIMDNACKFSDGKPVEVSLAFSRQHATLTVSDQGIGIREEEVAQVFEPLYRASNAITFQGHGLGLSLSGKILALHHAQVRIQSRLNEGTQLTVVLPVLA